MVGKLGCDVTDRPSVHDTDKYFSLRRWISVSQSAQNCDVFSMAPVIWSTDSQCYEWMNEVVKKRLDVEIDMAPWESWCRVIHFMERHSVTAELKCVVPMYKVHIEHGGGVFVSTSRDHEHVTWIGPGTMPQESRSLSGHVQEDSVGPEAYTIRTALFWKCKNKQESEYLEWEENS